MDVLKMGYDPAILVRSTPIRGKINGSIILPKAFSSPHHKHLRYWVTSIETSSSTLIFDRNLTRSTLARSKISRTRIWGALHENVLPRPHQEHQTGNNSSALQALLESRSEDSSLLSAQCAPSTERTHPLEEFIERIIFDCRFFTLMAVVGSLAGSLLCFLKGCLFVWESFMEYFHGSWQGHETGKVILLLVEAVDVYLIGTVMLIFGMGLYELFVSTIEVPGENPPPGVPRTTVCGSNLFGLFRLRERPQWLEIRSLDELKTKLGHVIVMILFVGMFEKSKKVPIQSGLDLLCFSASIFFSSGCLFLLSKLNPFR